MKTMIKTRMKTKTGTKAKQANLDQLVSLDWGWRLEKQTQGSLTWYEWRIDELPGYLVAGRTRTEADRERQIVLRGLLAAYIKTGQQIPIPKWKLRAMDSPSRRDLWVTKSLQFVPA